MKRTTVLALLTMLIGVPSILVAEGPDQIQATTPVFDVTSLQLNIPSDTTPHVSAVVSDMSLTTFVSGIELLLARDKELARALVAAVERENRSDQAEGILKEEPRIHHTLISPGMSLTDLEQIIHIALADNARLARALIAGQ